MVFESIVCSHSEKFSPLSALRPKFSVSFEIHNFTERSVKMPKQKISREEILLRAIALFRTKGYNNTSMSDIAEACGVFKSNFYHHFRNKEELMVASLAMVEGYFEKKLFSVCMDDSLSVGERFSTITRRYRRFFGNGQGGCFFANTAIDTSHTQEFKEELRLFFNRWIESLAHLFSQALPNENGRSLALHFVQQLEGAVIMMSVYGDDTFLDNTIESARKQLKLTA